MELDQPKVIRAWTFYDWANSAYSLIITSAIFPAYYSAIAPETISFFGYEFKRASVASYSIALSFLIVAFISPILSSIADYKGNKKLFMKVFCYLGAAACMALFFYQKDSNVTNVYFGLFCSVVASIGYCGSIVFYNAFLPEIASKAQQDTVSAKGFSMGYIGSVLLMILCFHPCRRKPRMESGSTSCTYFVFGSRYLVDSICTNTLCCIKGKQART